MAEKRNFIFYVNWKYIIIRIHMVYLYKLYVYIGNPPTHCCKYMFMKFIDIFNEGLFGKRMIKYF